MGSMLETPTSYLKSLIETDELISTFSWFMFISVLAWALRSLRVMSAAATHICESRDPLCEPCGNPEPDWLNREGSAEPTRLSATWRGGVVVQPP